MFVFVTELVKIE